MANDGIKAAIEEARARLSLKMELTPERILKELARVALSDARKLYNPDGSLKPVGEWDDDTAAAVASVELAGSANKVRLWNKPAALKTAMEHLRLLESAEPPAPAALPQIIVIMPAPAGEAVRQLYGPPEPPTVIHLLGSADAAPGTP